MTLSDLRALAERLQADAAMNEEIPVKTHLHATARLEREAARALLSALTVCEAAERQAECGDRIRARREGADSTAWQAPPHIAEPHQQACTATEHAARAFRDAMARENEETKR